MDKINPGIILAFIWFGIIGVAGCWAVYRLFKDIKNSNFKNRK